MQAEKLSEEISPDVEAQMIQSIKDMYEQQMPFLKDLAVKERRRMAKLSPRYADFVDTGFRHAQTSPRFLPNFITLEEFTKDMNLRAGLRRIHEEVRILEKRLRDTIMVVDSEAYQSARLFYKSVKAAALEKEKSAEMIAKDLAYHHKKKGNNNGSENGNGNGTGNGTDNGSENGAENGEETVEDVV
jgi:hypothetical protein